MQTLGKSKSFLRQKKTEHKNITKIANRMRYRAKIH